MKRLWDGLIVGMVFCQLPLVACAAWGIYDPVTDQQGRRVLAPRRVVASRMWRGQLP